MVERELVLELAVEGGGAALIRTRLPAGGWQYYVECSSISLDGIDDQEWLNWSDGPFDSIEEALHSRMVTGSWVLFYPMAVHPAYRSSIWKMVEMSAHKLPEEFRERWHYLCHQEHDQTEVTFSEPVRRFGGNHTEFDITIDGESHKALPARMAMLRIVKHLCGRGVSPEDIAKCVPWRRRMFFEVNADVSSEVLLAKTGGQRYFCGDNELIRCKGRTYALSSVWGGKTAQAIQCILDKFLERDVSYVQHEK